MNDRSRLQASRLLRFYPRRWREQFPDFEELLFEELAEGRRGTKRNVLWAASVERLRGVGVIPRTSADRARSGLALIYAALVPFAGLAMGMWSQLHTGLASSGEARSPALSAADLVLVVGALAVLIMLPLGILALIASGRRNRRDGSNSETDRRRTMVRPTLILLGSIAVLTVAGRAADRSGWYSPATAALPRHGPGFVATLWIRGIVASVTPAWVRPGGFTNMPAGELIAALIAPLAALTAAGALFRLLVQLRPPRPGWINSGLAVGPAAMMSVSVAACGRWLVEHPGREGGTAWQVHADQLAPGHTGWIVVILLAALAAVALLGLGRLLRSEAVEPTDPPLSNAS